MIICVTPEDAAKNPALHSDVEGGSGFYITGSQSTPDAPLAFNAKQTSTCVLPAHFHPVDQFQVWTEGFGTVGSHPVSAGTIHYSDAYTAYGPLVPGEQGFAYLTLRPCYDVGYHVLPDCRELLLEKRRERKGGQKVIRTDLDQRRPSGLTLLWSRLDGVSISRMDAGAGEALPRTSSLSGRYYLLLRGSIFHEGKACASGTCIWADPGVDMPSMQAGEDGAMAAMLCFAKQGGQASTGTRSGRWA